MYLAHKQSGDALYENDTFDNSFLKHNEDDNYLVHNENVNCDTGEIRIDEVRAAIKSSSNNKSGGVDGIKIEVFKCLNEEGPKEVTEAC